MPKTHPSSSNETLYFGYGSNLFLAQMRRRCPSSEYVGLGRLRGHKWIINTRGYANIVAAGKADEVWGMIYMLTADDEENLDVDEGVPYAYTKEFHVVDFWATNAEEDRRNVLVYIDKVRVDDAKPKNEYVIRMNRGIEDAVAKGVPVEYVEKVMRRFIPEAREEDIDAETKTLAEQQAVRFREEGDAAEER